MKIIEWTAGMLFGWTGLKMWEKEIITGATFRSDRVMGKYGMSCQYWKADLKYMSSGHSRYLTGVGQWWWDESRACGQCLLINDRVLVVIADYCPNCSPKQLDLNDQASASLNTRERPMNYNHLRVRKVACDWRHKAGVWKDVGSDRRVWYLIPLYLPQPLKSLKVGNTQAYHDKYGRWVVEHHTADIKGSILGILSNDERMHLLCYN